MYPLGLPWPIATVDSGTLAGSSFTKLVKSGNGGFKLHLCSNVMTKRVRCVGILHGGRGVEHMKDIAKMIRCLTLKAFGKFESLISSPLALTIIYELLGGLNRCWRSVA